MSRNSSPAGAAEFLTRVRRWVLRRRRFLAALLFCAAAGIAVQQLVPAAAVNVPAVVAASDIAAGTVLSAAQLDMAHFPPGVLPGAAFSSPSALIGQQLATPVRKGSVLTDASILGPGLLAGTPEGTVAVPLRPADATTVQLVNPGQRVDVVVSSGNGYEQAASTAVLARGVVVLWASSETRSSPWSGSGDKGGLVVVAARPQEAAALAGASSSGQVHLVLVSGAGQGPGPHPDRTLDGG